MKRIFVLLLAMVLALTGCAGKKKAKDISVKDVLYPFRIEHKKDAVEITFSDNTEKDTVWQTQMISGDVCQVTQADIKKEGSIRYNVTGIAEGAEILIFNVLEADETVCFRLAIAVDVDSNGKVTAQSYQTQERKQAAVEENVFSYQWYVDLDGTLNFSFSNDEDNWSVRGDGEGICILSDMMSTPAGCEFSAQANAEGQTSVLLEGRTTQRKICVVLQVDSDGKIEVVSVQEQ